MLISNRVHKRPSQLLCACCQQGNGTHLLELLSEGSSSTLQELHL